MRYTGIKISFLTVLLIAVFLSSCATSAKVQTVYLTRDPDYIETKGPVPQEIQPETVKTASSGTSSGKDTEYNQRIAGIKRLYDRKNFTAPPVATVMSFNSQGLSDMEAQFISDYLSSALYNTKAFRIIDRNQRETLLKEMEFSMSGCSDESCQLEAGRLLSADKIIVGNLGKLSTRFIMDVRMIDVSSGETVSVSNEIYNTMDEMIDDCRFIAVNLTEGFLQDN